VSTIYSVCSDNYLNPYFLDESNEFDYIDNTDDFVDTTSVKYKAEKLGPTITNVILTQQAKAAEEAPKPRSYTVVESPAAENTETYDRHFNMLVCIAAFACIVLMLIAMLVVLV
jgi:hypothetical protein